MLALCLPAAAAPATEVNYTVGEKLLKQMQAGSGFTGTLTFTATAVPGREAEAVTTIKPVVFDVGYIFVREDLAAKTPAESRLTLALKDGENAVGSAELAFKEGAMYLKSVLTGDGWYSLTGTAAAGADTDTGAMAKSMQGVLSGTALPGLSAFAAGLTAQLAGADLAKLDAALEPYATKTDLWIEAYRQNALLGKADDGSTTMTVDYDIPGAAIKAQLKQLVMDMLADQELLPRLAALLPDGTAERFLNPALQNYYFYAIDQLPLKGAMVITRTVNLKGETLALDIDLPLYDAKGGAVMLKYNRHKGSGDLPDENAIVLTGDSLVLRADYQTYNTLTGTTVYQGTILRQPLGAEAFEVGAEDAATQVAAKTLSAAFTLSVQQTEATDAEGKTTQTFATELNLTPEYTPETPDDVPADPTDAQRAQYLVFSPMDLRLSAAFGSGQAQERRYPRWTCSSRLPAMRCRKHSPLCSVAKHAANGCRTCLIPRRPPTLTRWTLQRCRRCCCRPAYAAGCCCCLT